MNSYYSTYRSAGMQPKMPYSKRSSVFEHYQVVSQTTEGSANYVAICQHCTAPIKGSHRSTSNLIKHMKRRHPEVELQLLTVSSAASLMQQGGRYDLPTQVPYSSRAPHLAGSALSGRVGGSSLLHSGSGTSASPTTGSLGLQAHSTRDEPFIELDDTIEIKSEVLDTEYGDSDVIRLPDDDYLHGDGQQDPEGEETGDGMDEGSDDGDQIKEQHARVSDSTQSSATTSATNSNNSTNNNITTNNNNTANKLPIRLPESTASLPHHQQRQNMHKTSAAAGRGSQQSAKVSAMSASPTHQWPTAMSAPNHQNTLLQQQQQHNMQSFNLAGKKRKLEEMAWAARDNENNVADVPPPPLRKRKLLALPGERGVFDTEEWKEDSPLFHHIKHDSLVNTKNIEQFTFRSGSYFIADDSGNYCGSQHGHVVLMWRFSDQQSKLFVSRALLFTDAQLYHQIRKQLEEL